MSSGRRLVAAACPRRRVGEHALPASPSRGGLAGSDNRRSRLERHHRVISTLAAVTSRAPRRTIIRDYRRSAVPGGDLHTIVHQTSVVMFEGHARTARRLAAAPCSRPAPRTRRHTSPPAELIGAAIRSSSARAHRGAPDVHEGRLFGSCRRAAGIGGERARVATTPGPSAACGRRRRRRAAPAARIGDVRAVRPHRWPPSGSGGRQPYTSALR